MIKTSLAALAALTLATPAQAITWEEFWEPFDNDTQVHIYHNHPRPRRIRPRMCEKWVVRDQWVPGYYDRRDRWVRGHWVTKEKLKRVPCYKLY